jgi:hypothetical protein
LLFESHGEDCAQSSWWEQKENADVFREALDQVPASGQARPALENHPGARPLLDDAQRLSDVVIFLDDRFAQAPRAEVLRRADDGLLNVRGWVEGMIAYVAMTKPDTGRALRAALNEVAGA